LTPISTLGGIQLALHQQITKFISAFLRQSLPVCCTLLGLTLVIACLEASQLELQAVSAVPVLPRHTVLLQLVGLQPMELPVTFTMHSHLAPLHHGTGVTNGVLILFIRHGCKRLALAAATLDITEEGVQAVVSSVLTAFHPQWGLPAYLSAVVQAVIRITGSARPVPQAHFPCLVLPHSARPFLGTLGVNMYHFSSILYLGLLPVFLVGLLFF